MKRSFGLDLIRALAALFVVIVHSFLYQNFYSSRMDNIMLYLLTFIRNLSFICVPLFLLLTGYLKSNKKIDKKHYLSIKKIIIIYLIVSIICIPFKILYLNDTTSIIHLILGIFRFTTNNYSWYVEMYIGLFLLIPFINTMYHSIKTKKEKQLLILILFILCSLPISLGEIPIRSTNLNILPSWWISIYPILFYLIGVYIKEYQPVIKKSILILIILVTLFLQSTILSLISINSKIIVSTSYQTVYTVLISTSIFLLLYKVNSNHKKIIELISNNSLGIYLFSFIYDSVFYKLINFSYTTNKNIILSIIIIVPLVFICSLISSIIINKILSLIPKLRD